MTNIH